MKDIIEEIIAEEEYKSKEAERYQSSQIFLNSSNYSFLPRGGGMSFFPVKHEKFPFSYIQDAKNFSVVKPLISGEARASLASLVPTPL